MTLYWFLLVTGSLATGSVPPADLPWHQSWGASGMLLLGWLVLMRTAVTTTLRAIAAGLDEETGARLLERQLEWFRWLGLVVVAVCLLGFRVAGAVQCVPLLKDSFALQGIVLLFPGLLINVALIFCEYTYAKVLGYVHSGRSLSLRLAVSGLMASGAWITLPVLAVLGCIDLFGRLPIENQQSVNAMAGCFVILCVPFIFPLMLRLVWRTAPLTDPLQKWLVDLVRSQGFPWLGLRVWDTAMRNQNAMVAGFLPGLRSMVLTDRLLASLPRPSLGLVVMHELGHIRRMHLWLRVLAMMPGWIIAIGMAWLLRDHSYGEPIGQALALVFSWLSLRYISHATEYDADRWACEQARFNPLWIKEWQAIQGPQAQASIDMVDQRDVARLYAQTLMLVTGDTHACSRSSWLHPSVKSRCDRLHQWALAHEFNNQSVDRAEQLLSDGVRCMAIPSSKSADVIQTDIDMASTLASP